MSNGTNVNTKQYCRITYDLHRTQRYKRLEVTREILLILPCLTGSTVRGRKSTSGRTR